MISDLMQGDLIFIKNGLSYLAKKYKYFENKVKLFVNFIQINDNDLFILINMENDIVKIFNIKTGEILEAYSYIFIGINKI